MGKTSILNHRVNILSGTRLKLENQFEYNTGWVFPTDVEEDQYTAADPAIEGVENLNSEDGGEGFLSVTSQWTAFQFNFDFTGNEIPSNANITKIEFAYKSRIVYTDNATNPSVVGDPPAALHYQPAIGFFYDGKDYSAAGPQFGYDQPGKSFTVDTPIRNNEYYPSEPYIENFYHLASQTRPLLIDQIQPAHINGNDFNKPYIKIARKGGVTDFNGSNLASGMYCMGETSTNPIQITEGQSIRNTYKIGILKDSTGPALKVFYNFSLE